MKIKRIIAISAIVTASILVLLAASAGTFYYILIQKPSVKFLLANSGFREPVNYTKKEIVMDVKGEKVPVVVYRHKTAKSDKYFMLQHGLTPQGHRHPRIDRFAASICDSTGMNVLIPFVKGSIQGGSLVKTYDNMADIYTVLAREFPGKYRAFGACIGANILLVALNRVPDDIYPEKIFMLGPFFDGKTLFEFYNRMAKPEDLDIMVKMAITLNMDIFSEKEKDLIRKAIAASKPGTTDRSEMKKILGDRLFSDIAVVKLHHRDFENINPGTMFGKNRARCKFFILHSKTDNVIPYFEGKNLAEFMKKSGISTRFLGTEYVEHAQNQASVTGFLKEMKYLIRFFDELFEGDVAI
ncbi:MAG TPA: hypothetical protein PKN50_02710 [Spirochaetota bacterium]|mgnify:CR=1 FL=1|nr:hypothetical protein [Spirochaetota bacterium]HPV43648.1 hypothetical protein [Spirochaetota bacterium]